MKPSRVAPVIDDDPDEARSALADRRIGPHVPIAAGLAHASDRARLLGAGVIAVFTDNPHSVGRAGGRGAGHDPRWPTR